MLTRPHIAYKLNAHKKREVSPRFFYYAGNIAHKAEMVSTIVFIESA